jgi:glycosyltransferase involved in cell wall biosynthesis
MRILYVTTLARGGPLTHLRALAPAIASRGFDVEVLCSSEKIAALFREARVTARVAPLRHKLDLAGAARLWPVMRGFDVIHTHDRRAGLFGRMLGVCRGARVVHTLHGLPEELAARLDRPTGALPPLSAGQRARHRLYAQVESSLARLGVVVTPSQAMRECLVGLGVPASRIEVIGHWMDVRQHGPRTRGDRLVVGVTAQLEPWKGVDVLIDACARVASPVRLEIFGDGSERTRLQRQAVALHVDAHFHGEVLNVRERLAGLDVFVLPSRAENSPLAIVEAMAQGLPVIGTRVGGVAELVDHGRTGLLVQPDDSESLAAALDRLATDSVLSMSLGRTGALRVARELTEARVVPRFEALYQRLVPSARTGAWAAR